MICIAAPVGGGSIRAHLYDETQSQQGSSTLGNAETSPSSFLTETLSGIYQAVAANLPSLVAALLVIIAGWFLARLARR
ncbi:MAG TPA: hypothetical protein VJ883_10430, partial [Woeseiaceae bacterium]|nr:hypothetical protein [Woeseiaceae bacterium]